MKIFCKILLFKILLFSFFFSSQSLALSPEERLSDPKLEARAMNLFLLVKCMVCNGQVIENSDTKFAHDMRQFIRQKITDGKTNDEIKADLIEQFGEEILLEPSKFQFLLVTFLAIISATLLFFWFFKIKKIRIG